MAVPVPAPVDPDRCPLCGQPNGCALQAERCGSPPQGPCWCTQVKFERAVLERIPPAARRLACVCRACATAPVPSPADTTAGPHEGR